MNNSSNLTLVQGRVVFNDGKTYTQKDLSKANFKLTAVMLAAMFLVGVICVSLFKISYTISGSMVPTLAVGEISVMRKVFGPGDLQRGDIVLFNPVTENNAEIAALLGNGEDMYIKRLIGLPGETIRIENDIVYINGVRLEEPYTVYPSGQAIVDPACSNMEDILIPDGYYFFMGDNRYNSYDSRFGVGLIPYENIDRKVMFHFTSISAWILSTDDDSRFI